MLLERCTTILLHVNSASWGIARAFQHETSTILEKTKNCARTSLWRASRSKPSQLSKSGRISRFAGLACWLVDLLVDSVADFHFLGGGRFAADFRGGFPTTIGHCSEKSTLPCCAFAELWRTGWDPKRQWANTRFSASAGLLLVNCIGLGCRFLVFSAAKGFPGNGSCSFRGPKKASRPRKQAEGGRSSNRRLRTPDSLEDREEGDLNQKFEDNPRQSTC